MEWVLFVSLQWVVTGTPSQATAQHIVLFPSEDRCKRAAEAIRTEIAVPVPVPNVQTYGRVVCFLRKD